MTYLINTRRLPDQEMTIAIEPQGEIRSEEAAGLLRDRFVMVLAATQPERIVVDLSAVPSISAAGIDALRSGYVTAADNHARVAVVHPAPVVREQLCSRGLKELVASSPQG
ncbi:STAS domain-containing protein [Pseudosporangium ferrugineum]|uniref:Anti-anti-sigma factor n=1 Tax=Pseudosporangium ferrugineum TaxID=439699 RepID=A0A2T0RGB8_9ACTN|nr:STAS domain-containing protein [Pseudosporangium ferrugineum]PRY20213.1 anti-anti-sigma factor [Pseudosporangium ferrugineum]